MDDPQLQHRATLHAVADLYEAHPYPPFGPIRGLFQRIRWEERQTLNYRALFGNAYGSLAHAAVRPRILVAGCGTFEPVVVALANPSAEIVAVDLSARSISLLRTNLKFRGLGARVFCVQADLLALPAALGTFDMVVATGVIHHLPDPAEGLRALAALANRRAVFRCMIYSAWGRSLLYAAKDLARELGVSTPKEFRRLIASLPPDHPYGIYFHLYSDAGTDAGLADGYLHPCDHAFTAFGLRDLLARAGLESAFFLHGANGQPAIAREWAPHADDWGRLALLEAYGELQENFRIVARKGAREAEHAREWEWNEALPGKGRLFSGRAGKELAFDRRQDPNALSPREREDLVTALFLVPKGGA